MGYSIRTNTYRYTEWHKNGYNTSKTYDENNIEFIELYDFEKDALETINLINDEKYSEVVKLLKEKLVKHLNKLNKKNNLKKYENSPN